MSEPDRGDGGARSWLGRITDLFTGEPSDRKDLMEMLRDAADRQLVDGEVLNIIFGALTRAACNWASARSRSRGRISPGRVTGAWPASR